MNERRSVVAAAIAVSTFALGFVVAATSLPIDDFWLSLASARQIFGGAPLEHAVELNWIPFQPGALNPQWGAQLIFGLPGSTAGALAINALLIGGGLAVLAVRVRRRATPEATAIAMLLAIAVLSPHLLARAQSFSIFLLPVALLLLEMRPARWQLLPVAYAVLMAAWANLHGAFVIGQLAAVSALAGAAYASWRRPERSRGELLMLAATVVAAFVAPLLNPAGIGLYAYAYAQPGLDVVREISIEWQPAWPWIPVATLFWVYLLLLVPGRIRRGWGVGVRDSLLLAALAVFAATSLRQIPWFVIAAAPLLAQDIGAALAAAPMLRRSIGTVPRLLRGRSLVALTVVALALAVLLQPLRTALPQNVGRVTPDAPVQIADELATRIPDGAVERVLNEQVWGGYLAYELGDRIEIAMDGRLEIRDRATWAGYFDLLHGEGSPAEELARQGVRYAALHPSRTELRKKLQDAGWQAIVSSDQGVLLAAP